MVRPDGRLPDELFPVRMPVRYADDAEGSVLVAPGKTRVLRNAAVEVWLPQWLHESKKGTVG